MAAVQAGYRVTAIDGFADRQTFEIAHTTIAVAYDDRGFNAEALMRVVTQLDASQYLGFVYGSGFEAQPNLQHPLEIFSSNLNFTPLPLGTNTRFAPPFNHIQNNSLDFWVALKIHDNEAISLENVFKIKLKKLMASL